MLPLPSRAIFFFSRAFRLVKSVFFFLTCPDEPLLDLFKSQGSKFFQFWRLLPPMGGEAINMLLKWVCVLVMVTRKCRTSLGFDPMSVIVYFEASSSDASIV